jgi:hypothetical protein
VHLDHLKMDALTFRHEWQTLHRNRNLERRAARFFIDTIYQNVRNYTKL